MYLESPDVSTQYAASVIPHPQHIDLPCMQTEKDLIVCQFFTIIHGLSPNVRWFQTGAQPRMSVTISLKHTTFPVHLEHPLVIRAFQNVY